MSHSKRHGRARRALHGTRRGWPVEFAEDLGARGKFGPPGEFGPPGSPGAGHGFGPGAGFGPPRGRGRGSGRAGRGARHRGDVRTAILVLLAEQPRHGYDLIKAIEERTGGAWAPSPGSVYPTLQALEDEGLVTVELVDGRKTASLTAAGREHVASRGADAESVFSRSAAEEGVALMAELRQLADATRLVAKRPELAAQASAVLAGARKEIYRLLADA